MCSASHVFGDITVLTRMGSEDSQHLSMVSVFRTQLTVYTAQVGSLM